MRDEPIELLGELKEMSVPSISVNVDFNGLLDRYDLDVVWELLADLKDLMS